MSTKKFDPSKVRYYSIKKEFRYNGKQLTPQQYKIYKKYEIEKASLKKLKRAEKRALKIPKGIPSKYFSSGTRYVTQQGHVEKWARPLTAKGGNNPNHNWRRVKYFDGNHIERRTSAKNYWGVQVGGGAKDKGAGGSVTILHGTKQWIRQIQISLYALRVQSENFRVVVGRRAMKVFQNSFKYQQFYSSRSRRWASLSAYTLKKRASRGRGNRILKEYGDLYNSIKIDENAGATRTRVYTDIVPANSDNHKKHSICYAGYHNEGKGTYGSAWNGHKPKPYIKRQFMGHSSYLNPFTDSFMRKIMKLYLFDSVFLVKKS